MAVTIAPERMTSERFQRIEHLVLSALELAPDERGRMLSTECHGDDELRREVESLLGFQHEAEDFISKPAIAAVAATLAAGELFESVEGQRLGPYRLIKELGHGGMGAVYLAERADEYQKLVAIKVVKRGLATHDLVTRLRSERQILATLDHPNIAKLLDGGALEDGSPYIVMDYVEGLPIDSYCDQHQLSVGQRLQLFRKVCAAVAYAHRNLVIHRDLKPNNIIVATDGTPRLLDFGIAKVLDPSLQTTDDQTATIARIMTPQYASPEQIRGFAVTTSSDIYSLGVLLYKLLSGHLPYQLKSLPPIEIERAVCEKEPERPSTAAARTREATGASTPQFEISNPKLLRGDLDNIVLMAMRKEPERRYESVDAFARDLQRYSAGLPVAARRNTLSYRGSKFIKRHRFGVAATALVVLTMIGGTAASIWQARAAEREKERAKKVSAFLEDTLKYSDPFISPLKKAGKEITVNEVLDEAGRRLDSGEFDSDPELKAELLRAIVQTYFGQGQYASARKYQAESVALLRSIYGEDDPRYLEGSMHWAALLFDKGELTESEAVYRHYLPAMRSKYSAGVVKPVLMADALDNFAYLRRTQGDSHEAEMLFREALAIFPKLTPQELIMVASTRSTLASTIGDQGRFEEALATAREAVEEIRARGETGSATYGFALNILGGFLTEKGAYTEADATLNEAQSIFREMLNPSNLWVGDNLRNQATSLYFQGKYADAIQKADAAEKIYLEQFGKHYDQYPTVLIAKGLALTKMGQTIEGEKALREAVKLRTESLPKDHYWVALAKSALGEGLLLQAKYEEAGPLLRESFETLRLVQGPDNPRTKLAQLRLEALESIHK